MIGKDISWFQILILIALFISANPKNKTKDNFHILTILLAYTSICEIILTNIQSDYYETNHYSYFLNSTGVLSFYYLIYRKFKKKITDFVFMIWFIYSMIIIVQFDLVSSFSFTSYTIGLSLIVIMILYHFYYEVFISNFKPLAKDYKTWLGIGIIMFFACSFPMLIFLDELIINEYALYAYNELLILGNLIMSTGYLLAAIALWNRN